METNINFKNRKTDKESLSTFGPTYPAIDEDRLVEQDCSNETLNWVLKNAGAGRQIDVSKMQKSLDTYASEFANFAVSPTMHAMLQRAIPDIHNIFLRVKLNVDTKDTLEILYITMTYLIFNPLELTHFMTSMQRITETDAQIAATGELVDTHIYNVEFLQKKSKDYLNATALALQVGLIVKVKLEDKSSPLRFKDVFIHLGSFHMLDVNDKLRAANPRIEEWNAVDLNESYKKMTDLPPEMPAELYFDEDNEDIIYDSPRKLKQEGDLDGEHNFDVAQFNFVASDDIEQFFN